MTQQRVHIVGAGLAGLAAALQLALNGLSVSLYEAAPFAGGRARSFMDRELGVRIDNGSHLVLSGNAAVQDYLYLSDAQKTMGGPGKPIFPFFNPKTEERWTIEMNKGRIPFWLFNKNKRIPGTKIGDYLSMIKMMTSSATDRVVDRVDVNSPLYKKFWEPMTIGVLNTEPEIGSARLLANVLAQSFAIGGSACIPMIPKQGLSESFVDPAIATLNAHNVQMHFGHRLRGMDLAENRITALDFYNGNVIDIPKNDWVILALPAWVSKNLLPEITMPDDFRSIINAHFRVDGIQDTVGLCGIIDGLAEWVFVRDNVVSATVSCAERYGAYPVRDMAYYIWQDIAKLYGRDPEVVPPHRIFKEKYATFCATPEQDMRRPLAYTGFRNLALAGEWTATELPSTIEGAIRSGFKAAQMVMRWE